MNRKKIWLGIISLAVCVSTAWSQQAPQESRWEKDIAAFEAWDAKNSWPRDAVLFVGSSSIRMWRSAECFPNLPVINRGFGGSETADIVDFMDRIVLKYAPRLIVFYAGDNDIAAGKDSQRVFENYKTFVTRLHNVLPRTCVVYMAIKPSQSRWHLWPKASEANRLIREYSADDTRLFYVDAATPLLAADGTPDEQFYLADKLHLSDAGYRVWTELLAPIYLAAEVDPQTQSLALMLIKKGMGPHKLTPEELAAVSLPTAQPGTGQTQVAQASHEAQVYYVASKTSKIFHKSTCRFAGTISDKNRQTFTTRDKAVAAGRRPCRTCNP